MHQPKRCVRKRALSRADGRDFQESNTVVVWLGPDEDGNVAKAMTVIRFVHSRIPNPGHGADAVYKPGVPTIRDLEKLVEREQGVKMAWNALGTLFERQWWQRIWVCLGNYTGKKYRHHVWS